MDKTQFKATAEKAKARNGWRTEAARRLKDLPDEYLQRAYERIDKGAFDKETMPSKVFEKLIQHLLKDHANMIKLTFHTASAAQLLGILEPNSIDVILTDPPYERQFLPVYEDLTRLAAHVLKPGGSLVVMVGQSPQHRALPRQGDLRQAGGRLCRPISAMIECLSPPVRRFRLANRAAMAIRHSQSADFRRKPRQGAIR